MSTDFRRGDQGDIPYHAEPPADMIVVPYDRALRVLMESLADDRHDDVYPCCPCCGPEAQGGGHADPCETIGCALGTTSLREVRARAILDDLVASSASSVASTSVESAPGSRPSTIGTWRTYTPS